MKRLFATLLALLILLLCTGCRLWDGSYVSISPHRVEYDQQGQAPGVVGTYSQLRTFVLGMVDAGQQEAVITYSLAYQMFGEEKYKRLAKLIEDAAEEYFCDPDDDRWYLNIQISDPPARERKEKGPHTEGPFHFERMLIAMDILLTDGNIKRYIS